MSKLINEATVIKMPFDEGDELNTEEKLALLWLNKLAFNAGDLSLESQYAIAGWIFKNKSWFGMINLFCG